LLWAGCRAKRACVAGAISWPTCRAEGWIGDTTSNFIKGRSTSSARRMVSSHSILAESTLCMNMFILQSAQVLAVHFLAVKGVVVRSDLLACSDQSDPDHSRVQMRPRLGPPDAPGFRHPRGVELPAFLRPCANFRSGIRTRRHDIHVATDSGSGRCRRNLREV